MGHRRLFALVAMGLVLAASGCAGPARRAGMVGSAGNGGVPRLIRPADPIARLSPAPLTVGPVASRRDPGSYTRARPGPGQSGIGTGMLTVGGGQLANRGPRSGEPSGPGARVASRAELADRGGSESESRPVSSPSPALADGGWPVLAEPEQAPEADPFADPAPRPFDRGDELASGEPPSALGNEAPSGSPPMLTAGIDLETYATPPTSSDPDTRLASGRRPIAVLRNALTTIRPETTPEVTEAEPAPSANPEPIDPSESEVPALDPLPEPPEDPALPARDDVRPTSAGPGSRIAERPATQVDPYLVIETPSPFEPDRPRPRILSRVRDLGQRLIPGRDAPEPDRPAMLDRLKRSIPRLRGTAGSSMAPRGGEDQGRWWAPEVGHPSSYAGG